MLNYSQENLIKVARIIKPEGELTDEDLEESKKYFFGFSEGMTKKGLEK